MLASRGQQAEHKAFIEKERKVKKALEEKGQPIPKTNSEALEVISHMDFTAEEIDILLNLAGLNN